MRAFNFFNFGSGLVLLCLLGYPISSAAAGSDKIHTIEGLEMYIAYLADEMASSATSTPTYSIAPGCVGAGGGRCSSTELFEYIAGGEGTAVWKTKPKDLTISDITSLSLEELSNEIGAGRMEWTYTDEDGNVEKKTKLAVKQFDVSKAVPAAAGYKSMMQGLGASVNKLNTFYPLDLLSETSIQLIEKFKASASAGKQLRQADNDFYRNKALAKTWGVKVKDISTEFTIDGLDDTYRRFDAEKAAAKKSITTEEVIKASNKWQKKDSKAKTHIAMIKAAERLEASVECTLRK